MHALLIVLCASVLVGPAVTEASRCFDCHYLPPGFGRMNQKAGTPSCGLNLPTDADELAKPECASGTCFHRLDRNGLVYRGCANLQNLKNGVQSTSQCQIKGGSLHYYCQGDLCNSQDIVQLCGVKGRPGRDDVRPPANASNPCDGLCEGNPSGLYPDPQNKKGFLQCGTGIKPEGTCQCCHLFRISCPNGLNWNDKFKVCCTL